MDTPVDELELAEALATLFEDLNYVPDSDLTELCRKANELVDLFATAD